MERYDVLQEGERDTGVMNEEARSEIIRWLVNQGVAVVFGLIVLWQLNASMATLTKEIVELRIALIATHGAPSPALTQTTPR